MSVPLWALALAAYLLGSIPFSFLVARHWGIADVRSVGSGNVGATNVMRSAGRVPGAIAFLLDALKGTMAVIVAQQLDATGATQAFVAVAAVVGHQFPVWLGFRGGKGVATGCGAVVAVDPRVFLIAGLVWLATALAARFVSLASILMGVTFPIAAWWLQPEDRPFVAGCGLLLLLILVRNRSNISRLLARTEPRMGQSKKNKEEEARASDPR